VILCEKQRFRIFHFSPSIFEIFSRCKLLAWLVAMCATQKIYIPCIFCHIFGFHCPYLNLPQTYIGGENLLDTIFSKTFSKSFFVFTYSNKHNTCFAVVLEVCRCSCFVLFCRIYRERVCVCVWKRVILSRFRHFSFFSIFLSFFHRFSSNKRTPRSKQQQHTWNVNFWTFLCYKSVWVTLYVSSEIIHGLPQNDVCP